MQRYSFLFIFYKKTFSEQLRIFFQKQEVENNIKNCLS